MLSHKLSIQEILLRALLDQKFGYSIMRSNMLGLPILLGYERQSIYNAISRIKKRGYIERVGADRIMISKKGREYIQSRVTRHQIFKSPFDKKSIKDLLVVFDIPEDRKAEREWFRRQLKTFDYEMVQKSIWLGPSPLPKNFILYVKSIGMTKYIKIFRIASRKNIKQLD